MNTTLLAQYRDLLFRKVAFMLAAGWTVTRSCDGVTPPGTAGDGVNRWITAANIIAAATGVAHSWIILQSPAGASRIFVLIDCLDASAATPDTIAFYVCGADFATGGSVSARPTNAASSSDMGGTILSSTGVVPRRTHGWRDDQGTVAFAGITDGQGSPYLGILLAKLQFGESNFAQAWFCLFNQSIANPGGAFSGNSANLYSSVVWRTFGVSGVINNSGRIISAASEASLWIGGSSNGNSNLADFAIDGMANSATIGGYIGRFIDIRGCGNLQTSGVSQAPQDTDSIVRKSCGSIWFPTPTGTVLQH